MENTKGFQTALQGLPHENMDKDIPSIFNVENSGFSYSEPEPRAKSTSSKIIFGTRQRSATSEKRRARSLEPNRGKVWLEFFKNSWSHLSLYFTFLI